jgi:2-polyprenyl-3-methyl-5-hydroxy-6-metoxy-1,4-benzoquinol methylase
MLENEFRNTEKDYSRIIQTLRALGVKDGSKILDFGCSWGYGSWQLRNAGYHVVAYEISKPRCAYAVQELGVAAVDDVSLISGAPFDVFFSSHVLEHVPSVLSVAKLAKKFLGPAGLFVAFTPNGSQEFRERSPDQWNKLWNMVHPNFLDDVFYSELCGKPLLASSPYDYQRISAGWAGGALRVCSPLDGSELLVAAQASQLRD